MPHAPSAALSRRHQTIRATLREHALDALVVTSLPNVLYLTNFSGSAGVVVVTADQLLFLTDFRYVAALESSRGTPHECPGLELVRVDGSYDAATAALVARLPAQRVGVEAAHLSLAQFQWLDRTLGTGRPRPELVPTDGIVERARAVKDEYEIGVLRDAARRLSAVAADVLRAVTPGQTERELAMAIDWRIRQAGFQRTAFDTIVAAGPNGALPHARPDERKLAIGDLVVLDFGGVYDSYCVDLTRTVSIGPASDRAREVYRAVLDAHDAAIDAVRPGTSRFDVDAAARRVLGARGMADAFGHGTGHGLGIEVHEDPRIVRRRPDVDARNEALSPGMVFTVEPGAYFPGWGGVRIEDDVLVTSGGADVLTAVTTELLEI